MIINNKNITQYGAKLLRRVIQPTSISYDLLTPDTSLVDIVGKRKYGLKNLQIQLEFYGERSQVELNKSRLIGEILNEPVIQFNNIPNRVYRGYVETLSVINQNYIFETLELSILVSESSKTIESEFEKEIEIILSSTMETPAILEITPKADLNSITIDGFEDFIKLNNLKKGKPVIIDGQSLLVTEDGQNKFKDYDSWGFPKLKVGSNKITVTGNVHNKITYNPRWL